MKNSIIVFVLILFAMPLMAQQYTMETRNSIEQEELFQKILKEQNRIKPNSSNEIVLRIDTIIRQEDDDEYKEIYTYNDVGNLKAELHQRKEYNTWVNYLHRTYIYDNDGNMLSDLVQGWDDDSWTNWFFYEFTYNENGNYLTMLVKFWIDETWINHSLYSYTYEDNTNYWQSRVAQNWENEAWVNTNLITISYDSNGNWLTFLEEKWINDVWENDYIRKFTYDELGNMHTELFQIWAFDLWRNSGLHTYTYDANGNKYTQLYENWLNEDWKKSRIVTYTYDEYNNKLTEIWEYWEYNTWINGIKIDFDFSPGFVNTLIYEWDGYNWAEWTSQYGVSVSVIMGGEHILNRIASHLKLYYTDVTGIKDNTETSNKLPFRCYPNPVTNVITIELIPDWQNNPLQIELFNQIGQRVKSLEFSKSLSSDALQYNVDDLPGGLYMLQISNGNELFSQKIVISK